jgi:hypothetical protein
MKKRILLGTILPIFASVAVIGSGYAIWHFADTTSKESNSVSLSIEQVVQGASLLNNIEKLELNFDQTDGGRGEMNSSEASSLGVESISENGTSTAKGITLEVTKKDGTNGTVKYTNSTTTVTTPGAYATPEATNPSIGQVYTVTLTLTEKLYSYVDIDLTNSVYGKDDNAWKYATDETAHTYTWTNTTYGEVEFDWSNVKFQYKDSKEPKSIDQYNELADAISKATTTDNSCKVEYVAYRWAK